MGKVKPVITFAIASSLTALNAIETKNYYNLAADEGDISTPMAGVKSFILSNGANGDDYNAIQVDNFDKTTFIYVKVIAKSTDASDVANTLNSFLKRLNNENNANNLCYDTDEYVEENNRSYTVKKAGTLMYLDLSNNNLSSFVTADDCELFDNIKMRNLTTLVMRNCNITHIKCADTTGIPFGDSTDTDLTSGLSVLRGLTQLHLGNLKTTNANKLRFNDADNLYTAYDKDESANLLNVLFNQGSTGTTPQLETLDLSNNLIESLCIEGARSFNVIDNLSVLKLSGNKLAHHVMPVDDNDDTNDRDINPFGIDRSGAIVTFGLESFERELDKMPLYSKLITLDLSSNLFFVEYIDDILYPELKYVDFRKNKLIGKPTNTKTSTTMSMRLRENKMPKSMISHKIVQEKLNKANKSSRNLSSDGGATSGLIYMYAVGVTDTRILAIDRSSIDSIAI